MGRPPIPDTKLNRVDPLELLLRPPDSQPAAEADNDGAEIHYQTKAIKYEFDSH